MVAMNTSSVDRRGDLGGWLRVGVLQHWLLCTVLMRGHLHIKGKGLRAGLACAARKP
jgi:hypothetical protein